MKEKCRLSVDDEYEQVIKFSQEDVLDFAELTGDNNPIHIDQDYASKTIFKRTIVHGFLSASVFSKVFGTIFPGEGTIYLYQDMKFQYPVFVDKEYVAKFRIIEINRLKNIGKIECLLQESETQKACISGLAILKNDIKF